MDELSGVLQKGGKKSKAATVFRVVFHYAGEARADSRPGTAPDDEEAAALIERLARMDRLAKQGAWTRRALELIERWPRRRAAELAEETGRPLRQFKAEIRRLKGLGLTVSHEVGYELSPRGVAVLTRLRLP